MALVFKDEETKGRGRPGVYCPIISLNQFLNRILNSCNVDFVMETATVGGQLCHNHQFGHLWYLAEI